MAVRIHTAARTRTTLDLPSPLLIAADAAVARGLARSRNALMTQALASFLRDLEEREIDEQIAQMAHDPEYQALMEQICEEFTHSDWEAWQVEETNRSERIGGR